MKRDYGFSLIMAIVVILFFSLLSVITASMFSTDIQIALDCLRSSQAFFIAESAINYCIKNELIDDSDWSDNKKNPPDTHSLAPGIFTIEYVDPNKEDTTIKFTGKVDDIIRQITVYFNGKQWPESKSEFPYCLYVGKDFYEISSDVYFEGCLTVFNVNNNPNYKMVDIDWDTNYYINMADTILNSKLTIDPNFNEIDSNNTITKNFYVKSSVEIKNNTNLTIKGIIVAEQAISIYNNENLNLETTLLSLGQRIELNNCFKLSIIPPYPYPALVARNTITMDYIFDTTITGGVFTERDITIITANNICFSGVLYSERDIVVTVSSLSNLGTLISWGNILISKSSKGNFDWSDEILIRRPGFSWFIDTKPKKSLYFKPRISLWKETPL